MSKITIELPDGHFYLEASVCRYDISSGIKQPVHHIFCAVAPDDVYTIHPYILEDETK